MNLYGFLNNSALSAVDYMGLALQQYSGYPNWVHGALKTSRPGKYAGETNMKWPKKIANAPVSNPAGGWDVKLNGTMSGDITLLSGMDPNMIVGSSKLTLLGHEHVHVDNTRSFWSDLINATKNIEGTYCNEDCAKAAVSAANELLVMAIANANIEDLKFDFREYGYAGQTGEYDGPIAQNQATANEAAGKLDQFEAYWRDAKCSKSK